jgi:hypothetical protein
MTRVLLLALTLLYAALPPGFCACRIEAAVTGHADHHDADDTPCPDEGGDCDCPQWQLAQVSAGGAAPGPGQVASLDSPAADLSTGATACPSSPCPDAHASWPARPLYLTLRALRI